MLWCSLRAANPRLSVLVSLGGQAVRGPQFRQIVSRKDQLANFTQSINQLYQEKIIQASENTAQIFLTRAVAGPGIGLAVASAVRRQEGQDQAHPLHAGKAKIC